MTTDVRDRRGLLDELEELSRLQDLRVLRRSEQIRDQYAEDPTAWIHDFIRFPEGQGPTEYQEEKLSALAVHRRVADREPRGAGKTAPAAWVVLWFANTFEGTDWKIVTTAGAWRQLTKYLWPEIHKWARLLDWTRLGRSPYSKYELQTQALKLSTGEAFAVASTDPDLIEGAHAENLLTIVDEAKAVPAKSWDAIEGYFSDPGFKLVLAQSVPGEAAGRFYEIHSKQAGYEDWHTIHVTPERALAAGRITEEWVEARRNQWGEDSPMYRTYVKAEFAGAEDGAIPLSWVEAAIGRWEETPKKKLRQISVDVADTGEDQTVIARLYGRFVDTLEYHDERGAVGEGIQATVGHAWKALGHGKSSRPIVIDSIGVGAGVVGQLREKVNEAGSKAEVLAFNASESTKATDSSGELEFTNKRAAAWWNMRELLHPDNPDPIALPPDDRLMGDLTSPKWLPITSSGKLRLESKDDIRKRLGRSTDAGDAVVMLFWKEPKVVIDW